MRHWVTYFSEINVYRREYVESAPIHGGSRDVPTRFMINCCNQKHGCPISLPVERRKELYEESCRYISTEAASQLNLFECPLCDRKLGMERSLATHILRNHADRPDTYAGCGKGGFKNNKDFRNHVERNHSGYAKGCAEDGCKSKTVFKYAEGLAKHL